MNNIYVYINIYIYIYIYLCAIGNEIIYNGLGFLLLQEMHSNSHYCLQYGTNAS